ncbi:hypothetical protein DLM75_02900 [Leptospira stimsonii]|uniref:Uncharacterized protein n=1 Tax=Leptospira stimsonii TaxID=2202203 RepID=A0A396ZD06_9LEPT|nr:hypothetical protein DLM75_02900 [Leptospira stimsonii]
MPGFCFSAPHRNRLCLFLSDISIRRSGALSIVPYFNFLPVEFLFIGANREEKIVYSLLSFNGKRD